MPQTDNIPDRTVWSRAHRRRKREQAAKDARHASQSRRLSVDEAIALYRAEKAKREPMRAQLERDAITEARRRIQAQDAERARSSRPR
jgi:hypothetical protein